MRIARVHCDEDTELHIWSRHRISPQEVSETTNGRCFIIRGRLEGLYEVFGRTEAGRYLTTVIRYLGDGDARLITARDMNWTERRRHDRHLAH